MHHIQHFLTLPLIASQLSWSHCYHPTMTFCTPLPPCIAVTFLNIDVTKLPYMPIRQEVVYPGQINEMPWWVNSTVLYTSNCSPRAVPLKCRHPWDRLLHFASLTVACMFAEFVHDILSPFFIYDTSFPSLWCRVVTCVAYDILTHDAAHHNNQTYPGYLRRTKKQEMQRSLCQKQWCLLITRVAHAQ